MQNKSNVKKAIIFFVTGFLIFLIAIFALVSANVQTSIGLMLIFGAISFVLIGLFSLFNDYNESYDLNIFEECDYEEINIDIERSYKAQSILKQLPKDLTQECIKLLMKQALSISPRIMIRGEYIYEILRVDFDDITRKMSLDIKTTHEYRTIERYVQVNYERSPIYSELKIKERVETKSIRLTNAVLENKSKIENLHVCMSNLFPVILCKLNNPALVPSWLLFEWLYDELKRAEKVYNDNDIQINSTYNTNLQKLKERRKFLPEAFEKLEKPYRRLFAKHFKLEGNPKKQKKASEYKKKFLEIDVLMQKIRVEMDGFDSKEQEFSRERDGQINENKIIVREYCQIYEHLRSQIRKLETEYKPSDNFIKLKEFVLMEYKRMMGCYIIRNVEKQKCYVGQSKDIFKRIRQHFKNTEPINYIFAEDYYTSAIANREDLFEIKIIELATKDELDAVEKELIEEYDAYRNGYNGTQGNN